MKAGSGKMPGEEEGTYNSNAFVKEIYGEMMMNQMNRSRTPTEKESKYKTNTLVKEMYGEMMMNQMNRRDSSDPYGLNNNEGKKAKNRKSINNAYTKLKYRLFVFLFFSVVGL
jgi:hypothetical protein